MFLFIVALLLHSSLILESYGMANPDGEIPSILTTAGTFNPTDFGMKPTNETSGSGYINLTSSPLGHTAGIPESDSEKSADGSSSEDESDQNPLNEGNSVRIREVPINLNTFFGRNSMPDRIKTPRLMRSKSNDDLNNPIENRAADQSKYTHLDLVPPISYDPRYHKNLNPFKINESDLAVQRKLQKYNIQGKLNYLATDPGSERIELPNKQPTSGSSSGSSINSSTNLPSPDDIDAVNTGPARNMNPEYHRAKARARRSFWWAFFSGVGSAFSFLGAYWAYCAPAIPLWEKLGLWKDQEQKARTAVVVSLAVAGAGFGTAAAYKIYQGRAAQTEIRNLKNQA